MTELYNVQSLYQILTCRHNIAVSMKLIHMKHEKAASAAYVKSDVGQYRCIDLLRSLPISSEKH